MNSWVYVIDPETYQLRYINEKTSAVLSALRIGDVCYRSIMNQSTPCEDCPMKKLLAGDVAKSIIPSYVLNAPVVSEAANIQWNGSSACLITCRNSDQ